MQLPAIIGAALGSSNFMPVNDIGFQHTVQWCAGGISGGVHNTLARLFSLRDVEVEAIDEFRELYFALVGDAASGAPLDGAAPDGGGTLNNVVLFTRMLPVLHDLVSTAHLSTGEPLTEYAKLRVLTHKICSLIEAETATPSLARAGHPLTCAVLDGMFTHAACGDLNYDTPDLHEAFPRNGTCRFSESAAPLQSRGAEGFDWSRDAVELELFDLRARPPTPPRARRLAPQTGRLYLAPRTSYLVPNKLASREFLTYLALYKSTRLLYQLSKEAATLTAPRAPARAFLPGWTTVDILEFDERTRKSLNNKSGAPPPHVLLSTVHKFLKQSFVKPAKLVLPRSASGLIEQNVDELVDLLANNGVADYLDAEAFRGSRALFEDLRNLLNDPIMIYKSVGDVLKLVTSVFGSTEASRDRALVAVQKSWAKSAQFLGSLFQAVRGENLHIKAIRAEPSSLRVPFAFLAQRPPCDFAIGVRGTNTFMEWSLDFQLWLHPDPVIPGFRSHRGVASLALTLLPQLQLLLQRASAAHNCTCDRTSLWVTGHSLGASVAFNLAAYLAHLYRGCAGLQVHAVLFAPLKHVDLASRQLVTPTFNFRTLLDVGDPLFHLPCGEAKLPRCGRGHIHALGAGADVFTDHDNLVLINVPKQQAQTTDPNSFAAVLSALLPPQVSEYVPLADAMVHAHSCAHSCAFSSICAKWQWGCSQCPA